MNLLVPLLGERGHGDHAFSFHLCNDIAQSFSLNCMRISVLTKFDNVNIDMEESESSFCMINCKEIRSCFSGDNVDY